jgi:hypothetical protein
MHPCLILRANKRSNMPDLLPIPAGFAAPASTLGINLGTSTQFRQESVMS